MVQRITPFLWLNGQAEEAARFYTSIFKRSRIVDVSPMSATFRLDGLELIAFNGGPAFEFTPALSLFVTCRTQKEIDHYWRRLSAGGTVQRCGWLTDKFGVSWQVVPDVLGGLLGDDDEVKAGRAMQAMMKMKKLDIATLKKAHAGRWRA
jgi:predicted 3-demethylubiquinone-9 3-methyltransferase (glyoxalase superfamily)